MLVQSGDILPPTIHRLAHERCLSLFIHSPSKAGVCHGKEVMHTTSAAGQQRQRTLRHGALQLIWLPYRFSPASLLEQLSWRKPPLSQQHLSFDADDAAISF